MDESSQQPTPQPPRIRRSGQRPTAAEKRRTQDIFLAAFAEHANHSAAARIAGVRRETIYRWQEHDATFSARYHVAAAEADDVLRAEIYRRGVQGVEKPLVNNGRVVKDDAGRPMMVREYSDRMLELLARARMAEFRDRQQVDVHATVDVQGAAAEADKLFAALVGARGPRALLGEPETGD